MVQEDAGVSPQSGVLLRRAHDLLESLGQPTAEDLLIKHLFGANGDGNHAFWTVLLRQTLASSSLFESSSDPDPANNWLWSLKAWRNTQQALDEVEFVVLDTETTGLDPGEGHRIVEVACIELVHHVPPAASPEQVYAKS